MIASMSAQTPDLAWALQMGGSSSDNGTSITVDATGNVYTTGSFFGTVDFDPGAGTFNLTSVGSGDIFISKLDVLGNFVWAVQMGGANNDDGRSIAVDASGNIYTTGRFVGIADFDPGAGTFNLTSAGSDDIFISKLDASGNFVWAKQMGETSFDIGISITLDASGNVYSTGYFFGTVDFDPGAGSFNLTASSHDIYISKLDAVGNFLWAKQMGGNSIDFGLSIVVDASGNIYTSGHFRDTADFDPGAGTANLTSAGDQDIFVSKLDASGNFVWVKQLGGIDSDGAQSMAVDVSGNVFTAGYFKGTADFDPGAGTFDFTSAGDYDIFVSKLDASGNFVWAKQMGGSSYDEASEITVDSAGNVYTAGGFTETVDFDPGTGTFDLTSAGGIDVFINKLDATGNFVWAVQMGSTKTDFCLSIALDNAGNVHSTGYFEETVDFDPGIGTFDLTSAGAFDIFVQKLSSAPVVISENILFNDVKIYPNPTDGEVTLDLGSITNATISVFSVDGRKVYEKNDASNIIQFEINGIPGIYYLEITTQKGKQIFKLVKL
jgi:hypothetical protein